MKVYREKLSAMIRREIFATVLAGICLTIVAQRAGCAPAAVHLRADDLTVSIEPLRFRFGFSYQGKPVLNPYEVGGLLIDGQPASITDTSCGPQKCKLSVHTEAGAAAQVELSLSEHRAEFRVTLPSPGHRVEFETTGASPAYGLGDNSVEYRHYDTDVTGVSDDHLLADGGLTRLVSNFLIYPKQQCAVVLIDPTAKIVKSSREQIVMGVDHAGLQSTIDYFFGTPHQIYRQFLKVRNASGYPVFTPKYAMFGVGWEAFGALGWDTSQKTIQESIDRYLAKGYPIRWAVIGSGFWPAKDSYHETTSFGMFNQKKYPNPAALISHLHQEDVKVLLGIRICFITDGPYVQDGLAHSYFLKRDGRAEVFYGDWPKSPFYLLDAQNPAALQWYLSLAKKWLAFGVDGFKEDLYGYTARSLRDDKVNPINDAWMRSGIYVIERTGYLASDGDLARINDFNYDQDQDRGPVNALALAYSGLPLVYANTVGGTFAENHFDTTRTSRMESYMMRNAQWVALHCGITMGEPPWTFPNPEVGKVLLKAAQLHGRLQPYFYSQAVRFSKDGYPWPMTPLPIAYPDDPRVYGRGNDHVHGYEWLIGDALLATPLYGDDYASATARDVYLPIGSWEDYDTGQIYRGPTLLKQFPLPVDKDPLFVGGTGIVVELNDSQPCARVYRVAHDSTTSYWFPDRQSPVTLSAFVKDWQHPHAIDLSTHAEVPGKWVRHAWQFPIAPGHSYRVE